MGSKSSVGPKTVSNFPILFPVPIVTETVDVSVTSLPLGISEISEYPLSGADTTVVPSVVVPNLLPNIEVKRFVRVDASSGVNVSVSAVKSWTPPAVGT